jgi:hypothetical protein
VNNSNLLGRSGAKIRGANSIRHSKYSERQNGPCCVEQHTKVEFAINLATAKTLGLTFSLPLLGRADEMIE